MIVESMLEKYYSEFKGLPNNKPIVRNNQKNDAFALVVLNILYDDLYDFEINANNISKISNIIVAPPDSGIDIVVERDLGDEYAYDFLQVKYSDLPDVTIRECFGVMKRSVKKYLSKPEELSLNLQNVLNSTQFDSLAKERVNYFVVHNGKKNTCIGIEEDEHVVNVSDLERVYETKKMIIPKVKYDELKSDYINNFSVYGDDAYLINIRGYELALLANKYNNTEKGRNILFGQNLRDSLDSKSKTYDAMKKTIDNEPEQFWYYNNGITIVADDVDIKAEDGSEYKNTSKDTIKVDKIILKGFSIINGAQTSSSLGKYLREADDEEMAIEKLKKVYVFARILKVVNETIGNNIAIYNNTQNPITTRDMVSNNKEQRMLKDRLFTEKPNIYMETRRGTHIPSQPQILKHRRTTNEELAQLSYAGFMLKPFIAKDKKKSLFNKDYNDSNCVINEFYDAVFKYDIEDASKNGLLFNKSNDEIDELLFVKYLYKESNKYLKNKNNERMSIFKNKLESANESLKETIEKSIRLCKRNIEISNISMFYVITYYYYVKSIIEDNQYRFNVEKFYEDKKFGQELIKCFCDLFLLPTVQTIDKLSSEYSNTSSWIRSAKSQTTFIDEIANNCNSDFDLEEKVKSFIESFSKKECVV